MIAHDQAQSFHAVHAGHVEIKRHHVRLEFFHLFQGELTVHGSAHDLDTSVTLDDLRDQLAHQCGTVASQYAYGVAHAEAPCALPSPAFSSAATRPSRLTTA